MSSPYKDLPPDRWLEVTRRLVEKHPLSTQEIVDVVLSSWDSIFASGIGPKGFRIGKDIFPKPQIMGFFLHELIPLELTERNKSIWRAETSSDDKDIVYIPDSTYSIELKTSSNPRHIYGNRSYAQGSSRGRKAKSGYYLAVNFEKFTDKKSRPQIRLIRFGWIDSSDWIGQKAATGQQSRLHPDVESYKLLELYPSGSE
jgi:hypothetical protein